MDLVTSRGGQSLEARKEIQRVHQFVQYGSSYVYQNTDYPNQEPLELPEDAELEMAQYWNDEWFGWSVELGLVIPLSKKKRKAVNTTEIEDQRIDRVVPSDLDEIKDVLNQKEKVEYEDFVNANASTSTNNPLVEFNMNDTDIDIETVAVFPRAGTGCDGNENDGEELAVYVEGSLIGTYNIVERRY